MSLGRDGTETQALNAKTSVKEELEMQRRGKMQQRAFTLIELLVVIAIIALLLSVLMPSLRRAREQARNAVCVSHLHNWGNSYALYGNDYDQKVCPTLVAYPDNIAPTAIVAWDEVLKRYYVDEKIRLCASAKKRSDNYMNVTGCYWGSKNTAWQVGAQHVNGTIYYPTGSYQQNTCACYPESNVWEDEKDPVKLARLAQHWGLMTMKNGHEIPLMGDGVWREAWPSKTGLPREKETDGGANQGVDLFNIKRHTKSVDWVFLDGSVRHLLLPELWTLRWCKDFDTNVTLSAKALAWMTK